MNPEVVLAEMRSLRQAWSRTFVGRHSAMVGEITAATGYNLDVTAQPYRVPAERPDHYAEAWARLRKHRLARRVAAGALGYMVGTVLAVTLTRAHWFGPVSDQEFLTGYFSYLCGWGLAFGGVVFLGITFAVARQLVPFVCPRCAQPFFSGWMTEIGFTKNCVHCGLEVGSPMPVTSDDHESGSEAG